MMVNMGDFLDLEDIPFGGKGLSSCLGRRRCKQRDEFERHIGIVQNTGAPNEHRGYVQMVLWGTSILYSPHMLVLFKLKHHRTKLPDCRTAGKDCNATFTTPEGFPYFSRFCPLLSVVK